MMFSGLMAGDEVSVQGHRGTTRWKVTKVGRKWFTAGGCEFRLEDGTSKSGYSYPRASTLEAHAKACRVSQARKSLEAFGVRLDHWTAEDKLLLVYEALRPQLEAVPSPIHSG